MHGLQHNIQVKETLHTLQHSEHAMTGNTQNQNLHCHTNGNHCQHPPHPLHHSVRHVPPPPPLRTYITKLFQTMQKDPTSQNVFASVASHFGIEQLSEQSKTFIRQQIQQLAKKQMSTVGDPPAQKTHTKGRKLSRNSPPHPRNHPSQWRNYR